MSCEKVKCELHRRSSGPATPADRGPSRNFILVGAALLPSAFGLEKLFTPIRPSISSFELITLQNKREECKIN